MGHRLAQQLHAAEANPESLLQGIEARDLLLAQARQWRLGIAGRLVAKGLGDRFEGGSGGDKRRRLYLSGR